MKLIDRNENRKHRVAEEQAGELSVRHVEVLTAVLDLMVEEGDGFSMAKVARRASCSKETLYKWFVDRDGLLTATVRWQASKVCMPELVRDGLTLSRFRKSLEDFASNWLSVITGDISVALNRAAIAHAGSTKSRLGEIVLYNGPFAMARRLEPIFELGRDAGLIDFKNSQEVFAKYFGLVIGDIQIRALLGENMGLDVKTIKAISQQAVSQFLALYGTSIITKNGRKASTNRKT